MQNSDKFHLFVKASLSSIGSAIIFVSQRSNAARSVLELVPDLFALNRCFHIVHHLHEVFSWTQRFGLFVLFSLCFSSCLTTPLSTSHFHHRLQFVPAKILLNSFLLQIMKLRPLNRYLFGSTCFGLPHCFCSSLISLLFSSSSSRRHRFDTLSYIVQTRSSPFLTSYLYLCFCFASLHVHPPRHVRNSMPLLLLQPIVS